MSDFYNIEPPVTAATAHAINFHLFKERTKKTFMSTLQFQSFISGKNAIKSFSAVSLGRFGFGGLRARLLLR